MSPPMRRGYADAAAAETADTAETGPAPEVAETGAVDTQVPPGCCLGAAA